MFRTVVVFVAFVVCIACLRAVVIAQNFRGEAVAVIQRATPVEFSRMRFLTFAFGREGPMDTPLTTAPVMGREYFVEADLNGIEGATSVRFELLDAAGRVLQSLTMWKATDSSIDGEFYGFVIVPRQPFRTAVTTTTNGTPRRSVLDTLYQPAADGPQDSVLLPQGIPANQMSTFENAVNAYRLQLRAMAAQAAIDHPGGEIALPRTEVSPIVYEPLSSPSGAPIGLRLHYSIRFPSKQTIRVSPHVFPVYADAEWRGTVTMKPLTGSIRPLPQMVGVQSLQDVIVYQAAATYEAGVTYSLTIDLVPDFVFQGTQTGRFCIHDQKFTNRSVWDRLIASQSAVPYTVTISDMGTVATIPAFMPQRTFVESFRREGALDCGPTPNIRF